MAVSLSQATMWVQAKLLDDFHRRGSEITTVSEWEHGWSFVCRPPGQESTTLSPYIVDRRDGAVYTASSVIGMDWVIKIILAGPVAVQTSRRVFRVGVVGAAPDTTPRTCRDETA